MKFALLIASDKIADKRSQLWPTGIPRDGDLRYCAPGFEERDYVGVLYDLIGKTVPTPVASRWHDVMDF